MKKLITQIAQISTSADLNAVIEAVKLQQKHIRNIATQAAKATMSVGDSVNVKSRNGSEIGTIVKIKIKRATVDINGKLWNCPLSILEVA